MLYRAIICLAHLSMLGVHQRCTPSIKVKHIALRLPRLDSYLDLKKKTSSLASARRSPSAMLWHVHTIQDHFALLQKPFGMVSFEF